MSTKLLPGQFDCMANALIDEPYFVLLGRDPDAPEIVRIWAQKRKYLISRGTRPAEDASMCEEALQCAKDMESWRKLNDGRWRNPGEVRDIGAVGFPGLQCKPADLVALRLQYADPLILRALDDMTTLLRATAEARLILSRVTGA